MKKIPFLLLLVFLNSCPAVLLLGGAGAGAATVAYVQGELAATEKASLDQVYRASKQGLNDLELRITTDEKDALNAKIIAVGVSNKRYTLLLKREKANETTLKIRVGILGNEDDAFIVLEKIEKYL